MIEVIVPFSLTAPVIDDCAHLWRSSYLSFSYPANRSVNLPRVTAQLEKLMGTNVVRLTDRKYMQELQRRIQQDYNVTLEKRISEREVSGGAERLINRENVIN